MPDDLLIGIIGGTGLETGLAERFGGDGFERRACETPFGPPSGAVAVGTCGDVRVALLSRHGEGHLLNPAAVPYRANVFALKRLGCTHVVAFGATGSLREHIAPGEPVICDQLIDRTSGRPRTFFEHAAVHVEFADPFCPVLRRWLLAAAGRTGGVTAHERGCYVCIDGPAFSTRAESHLYRGWGADVVGMTALPEARLAREAEMAYALVALPTDYDCWRDHGQREGGADSVLGQVLENLTRATDASMRLLGEALRDAGDLRATPSPARDALSRAIWSDRDRIDRREVERLAPLWGRYMPQC